MRLTGAKVFSTLTTAFLIGFGGCADIIGVADNPQLVPTGPWRCLSETLKLRPPQQERVQARVRACNFVSTNCSEPVTGLMASLCNKRDVNCATPLRSGLVDTAGELTFDVPTGGPLGVGFDGFLQIRSSTALCTNEGVFGPAGTVLCGLNPDCDVDAPDDNCRLPIYAPSMLFFNGTAAEVASPVSLPLIPTAAVLMLTQAAGGRIDPSTGNVFVTTRDCDGKPAKGVQYTMLEHRDRVTVLYVSDGVISDSSTTTDESGIGGFLGVPPGFANIVATTSTGQTMTLEIAQVGVQVAPFAITYTTITPALSP